MVPGWPRHLFRDSSGGFLPAQTPSEPLNAVALAWLNQADKGLGPKTTLARKHTLHIVVAWHGYSLHALHERVASKYRHAVDCWQLVALAGFNPR